MRIIFMGSPDFAVPALRALHAAGHDIVAVYSQPPRPKGRGQNIEKTAVHLAAEELGLVVHTPETFKNNDSAVQQFQDYKADVAVVAAYGLILRKVILQAPRFGCINIHGSLLPRWRGAAPIQRAIEAGDTETGVTIMQMDIGLDTGPMLLKGSIPIKPHDTTPDLYTSLSILGADLIVTALCKLEKNDLPAQEQPAEGVTYAAKLTKEESLIDWSLPAQVIERKLRAFQPWPGLQTVLKDETVRIHAVEIVDVGGVPGHVVAQPAVVACGEKSLAIKEIQRPNRSKQEIATFLKAIPLLVGDRFGA